MSTLASRAQRTRAKSYEAHRILTGGPCQWLSPSGHRCRAKATWAGSFHGDCELFSGACPWLLVEVCAPHAAIIFQYDTRYTLAQTKAKRRSV